MKITLKRKFYGKTYTIGDLLMETSFVTLSKIKCVHCH